MKFRWKIWAYIGVLVSVGIYVWGYYNRTSTQTLSMGAPHEEETSLGMEKPSKGSFLADTEKWVGITNLNTRMKIEVGVQKENVYYYIRKDGGEIQTISPINSGIHHDLGNCSVIEVRLAPNQGVSTALTCWRKVYK